ncbi:MAG: glycosyltransferase [Actinomycetota bacterium]|nr:glycosyltransferase [Actinomycetota bacterium]
MSLFRKGKKQKWSIITAAPKGEAGRQWGDYWFAQDLAHALMAEGVEATVHSRAGANSDARHGDDVVVVLRGLRRVVPNSSTALWFLWVISHPELVEPGEAAQYTAAFAASASWNPRGEFGTFIPLLQATNTDRFVPVAQPKDSSVLFIGSTRGEFRPIVRDALAKGIPLSLYGVGWSEFVDPLMISGEFFDNLQIPAAYASAAIVLNDHHQEMAVNGFLSNRLFDAVAAGARVVSDPAVGLVNVFGSSVVEYQSPEQLAEIVANPDSFFPDCTEDRERIRREHSFAARARYLIAQANGD